MYPLSEYIYRVGRHAMYGHKLLKNRTSTNNPLLMIGFLLLKTNHQQQKNNLPELITTSELGHNKKTVP